MSDTVKELVSIIMPNYNGAKYVRESIDSIIAQSYENWELLFVDDCSTDESLKIVESYNDKRIRILQNETNLGAAISRNNAIREAKGKWIAFLDSDDVWDKDKLSKHLEYMSKNQVEFSCTSYFVVDEQNKPIKEFAPAKDEYGYYDILKHCYIGCSTVIYDCEKIGKVYAPENAPKREDFACWLSILKNGKKVACFHESLTTYRLRKGSVSSNKFGLIKYQWNVLRRVEKISLVKSAYYMVHWAIKGFLKYR